MMYLIAVPSGIDAADGLMQMKVQYTIMLRLALTSACFCMPASTYEKGTSKLSRACVWLHPLAPHENCPLPAMTSLLVLHLQPNLPSYKAYQRLKKIATTLFALYLTL